MAPDSSAGAPRFTFTRILVRDFPACFRFYRDVLGLTPTFGDETSGYADFDTGATAIALFDAAEMAEGIGAELNLGTDAREQLCLVFEVDDVDAAWQTAAQRGAATAALPADHPDWGIRTAHVRDPEGTLIELNAPLG